MADFIVFNEGAQYLITHGNGLPATCYFALSTDPVGTFTNITTLAGGIAEITGTGYSRQSQVAPTPVGEATSFTTMTWNTSTATNWPANVCSIVLVTSSDNTGHAICAWNLIPGGGPRNLSQVNVSEQVTPSLTTAS